MKTNNQMAWLKPLLVPLKATFREVLAMSLFVNILALAVPVFVLQVYDRVVFHAGISTLYGLVLGMGLVLVFDYVLRNTRARVMQTVALRIDVVVGRKLFEKLQAIPLQELENRPAAYWQSLFRDVDVVRNTLSGASALLVADLPFAILFLGLIFVIAAPIAWVLAIILPLFMFVAWRSGNVMRNANQEERASTQARDGLVAEMINGRTTIKALGLDRAMRPAWEERHSDNIERAIIRGQKTDAYSNLGATLTMMTSILLTSVGAVAIVEQKLTMGALIATNMLSGRLLGPLNQLVAQWRTYSAFKESVARLGDVFAEPSERTESEIILAKPKGDLRLEDVVFSYGPDLAPVVDHVSIAFPTNNIHAVVGRNGSGKSTILKLVQGLYTPAHGRVLLDGADISQFTRHELATWIGYVPQDCVLFQGTIRDNIAHRMPNATDEQIVKASELAGVHQFIIDMPDGYASDIGEAGRRLSGGQRQRIAIARALVGDPPVVMLDEPSSSLDRQAEQELRKTLREIAKNRTVLIITHSPNLLAAVDHLVALDRGKVALSGPAKDILPRMFGSKAPKQTSAPAAGRRVAPPPTASAAAAAQKLQVQNKTATKAQPKPKKKPVPKAAPKAAGNDDKKVQPLARIRPKKIPVPKLKRPEPDARKSSAGSKGD